MTLTEQDWMLAWVNLAHAGTHLTDKLDAELRAALSIGLAEQDLLKQVAMNQGEIAMSELARRLYYSKAGITKMVDRLVNIGLLKRKPSLSDRRVINIVHTAKGEKMLVKSRQLLLDFVRQNFRVHLNDRQIVELRESLRALLEGLGRYEGQMKHLKGEAQD